MVKKFLFFFIFPLFILGQTLLPPINNYRTFEYNAASKNWGLATNGDGELFVANNMGMLQYDGEQWTLNKLPHKTIIRSVAQIGNRIYTGSYEEFGYWKRNPVGLMEYTSLTNLIKGHIFTSEEFWQILPFGESILFRSFSKIYVYKDNKITVIDPHFVVNDMAIYKGNLMVGGDKGLFLMSGKKMVPIEGQNLLRDKAITDMVPIGEGLLIGTKRHGCYLLKNHEIEPWEKTVNTELKSSQLNKMLSLTNGKIAFGTIKNGIYIYDRTKNTFLNLNRQAGLQNNTVLSMIQFQNQLWVGLDNGIDKILLDTPIKYYTDFSGAVGTVYDIAMNKKALYLGSNTGIYYFQDDKLQFINGSQGHVWDMEVMDGELFCGHNTGTFTVNKGVLKRVSDFYGGYQIVDVPGQKPVFLQGTYNGIAKYEREGNGQWKVTRVFGLDYPIKQLSFENPTTLWAAHPYKGFYRIKMNANYDTITNIKEFDARSIPNNYNIKLYNIKNQIVFYSEGIWYKYDPILDKIDVFEQFKPYEHKDLIYYDDSHFWFVDNDRGKEIIYTDLKNDHLVISEPQLKKRLVPEAERIVKQNDSIFLFTLSDGFGEINLTKLHRYLNNFKIPTPKLTSFKDEGKLYPINGKVLKIRYKKSHDLTFKFAIPSLVQSRYFYQMDGASVKNGYQENGTLNFQNLPYGAYALKVYSVGIDNKRSEPTIVEFEIASPWYSSKFSKIGYLLGLLGVVFWVRWYNRRKLERKHSIFKEHMRREQEERLALMEKEKLAKEIRLKQNELASTTLNIAKKNEVILEIRNMLLVNKEKFPNQSRYRTVIKKLDNSINNVEDWKRFEVNFKELHEDFFEKLLQRYPSLTPKDLKLCAYLKMNLSSKEIAPLMAITNRGVEIHRYRLRKKLMLDSSENISNFLITFK